MTLFIAYTNKVFKLKCQQVLGQTRILLLLTLLQHLVPPPIETLHSAGGHPFVRKLLSPENPLVNELPAIELPNVINPPPKLFPSKLKIALLTRRMPVLITEIPTALPT